MRRIFLVKLVDGTEMDFDGKCDQINYNDSKVAVFQQIIGNDGHLTLAIIPYDKIMYILLLDDQKTFRSA